MGENVERQVAEPSVNKILTELNPGLYSHPILVNLAALWNLLDCHYYNTDWCCKLCDKFIHTLKVLCNYCFQVPLDNTIV